MSIAAIDQGTTGTKAYLFEEDGRVRVLARFEHAQHHPGPGRAEHDPEELLRHVRAAGEVAAKAGARVVGLANQGETVIAFDRRTGRPIAPAIVWQDDRTRPFVEALRAQGAEDLTYRRAGLPLDPYFSASKIRWVLDHVEEARTLLHQDRLAVGTSDAFFLWHLVGAYVTDSSTASRTSLLDLDTGDWDEELLRLFGIPREILPEIRPTAAAYGPLRDQPDTLLAANVVDQQAALFGHDCRKPGRMKITFGTGAFVLAHTGVTPKPVRELGILATVAWRLGDGPLEYAIDGGVYNATSAVDWVKGLGLFDAYEELVVTEPPALERGVAFVPALSGLACPYWDRTAAGLWIGLGLDTDRRTMLSAVLEGIALRTAEVVARFRNIAGEPEILDVDGGLAKNASFCRFFAEVTGARVRVPEFAEMTAYGAACLAARGGGLPEPPRSWRDKVYRPQRDRRGLLARFARAIARARGWREDDSL